MLVKMQVKFSIKKKQCVSQICTALEKIQKQDLQSLIQLHLLW